MKTKLHSTLLMFAFILVANVTKAQGIALPYYTGWDNVTERAGWTEYRKGYLSSYSWSNINQISHDYNVGGAPTQTVIDWYVSPALNFNTPSVISMKVQTGGFSQPTVDNCEIYFSDTKRDPALGTYTLIGNLSYMMPQYTWLDTMFAIPFITDTGYIAFKYKTIGAAWSTYSIDSLHIKADPSVSLRENSLVIAKIGPNPFSYATTISFNAPLKDAEVCIYSALGKLLLRTDNNNGMYIVVERQDLPSGIYFFEVKQDGKQLIKEKVLIIPE
jgi:hypothetical protein